MGTHGPRPGRRRRAAIAAVVALLVVATGCGGYDEEAATTTTQRRRSTTTTTTRPTTTTTEPETTTTTEPETTTTAPPATEPEPEPEPEDADLGWADYIPGVWVAPQPYGGDELWTFNGRTGAAGYAGTATWNYWPRGYGHGFDPLDTGVPAQINAGAWRIEGGDLIVETPLTVRRYAALRDAGGGCWAGDFDGTTITFCKPTSI